MALHELKLDDAVAWQLDHHVPSLWLFLFDAEAITESRRLHTTVFDAAVRFDELRKATRALPFAADLLAPFEEIVPDRWSRELGVSPDAVLSLDVGRIERSREFKHDELAVLRERWAVAATHGDHREAVTIWEAMQVGPLAFAGGRERDAIGLSARAEEFGLGPRERAEALVWLLFGRPVSRGARSLSMAWIERAREHPAVNLYSRPAWWRQLFVR